MMLAMAVLAGCANPYEQLEQTDWFRAQAAEVKETRENFKGWPRVGGYNEALLAGVVREDAAMPDNDAIALTLHLDDLHVFASQHPIHPRSIGLMYGSHTFAPDAHPRAGERWACKASANAKGHWFIHSAMRVDPPPSAE